jgi:hypothetical protein
MIILPYMEHLNTGIEGIEVNDIKGRGLGGEGSVGVGWGRSGCIDSGSVGDILGSVWVGFEVIVWWF